MSLRLHVMVTKNSNFFVPNDCSYGQLAKIQNFYLSLRLWSNRERLLAFQLLNSRESKFGDICGDKCLGIIISLQLKNELVKFSDIITLLLLFSDLHLIYDNNEERIFFHLSCLNNLRPKVTWCGVLIPFGVKWRRVLILFGLILFFYSNNLINIIIICLNLTRLWFNLLIFSINKEAHPIQFIWTVEIFNNN
jgi:hypothetical protein